MRQPDLSGPLWLSEVLDVLRLVGEVDDDPLILVSDTELRFLDSEGNNIVYPSLAVSAASFPTLGARVRRARLLRASSRGVK